MKVFTALLGAVLAVQQVAAHYRFTTLTGVGSSSAYQYVRQNTNHNSPITNLQSNDLRCNAGGASGANTQTATVSAGSTIGFQLDQAIYHVGVTNVYMAKAPSTAASFDGSGQVWFKVHEISAVTNGGSSITFPSDNQSTISFRIPPSTPSGQYLVRIEHIALHSASSAGGAQFYISCAQINVTGGGSGNPSPKVSIPGVYASNDPGIVINVYYPIPPTYKQPGPAVWRG